MKNLNNGNYNYLNLIYCKNKRAHQRCPPALWTSTAFPLELQERARNGWRERWCTVWCGRHTPYPTTQDTRLRNTSSERIWGLYLSWNAPSPSPSDWKSSQMPSWPFSCFPSASLQPEPPRWRHYGTPDNTCEEIETFIVESTIFYFLFDLIADNLRNGFMVN